MEDVKVSAQQARDFCAECFEKVGVPRKDAENSAEMGHELIKLAVDDFIQRKS